MWNNTKTTSKRSREIYKDPKKKYTKPMFVTDILELLF